MHTRLDFVSEVTGRVLLSALFDAPPEGFTRKLSFDLWRKMSAFKKELEEFSTKESGKIVRVRMTLDGYEASVFWYLLLFRPIQFEKDPTYGNKVLSIYDMLQRGDYAVSLKSLDLGIVWDEERNWLVIVWEEAMKGVLHDLRTCPSWGEILDAEEKRTHKKLDWRWWKKCAESFSYVIPRWRLRRLGYFQKKLWHRIGARFENITVIDLAGIDVPRIEAKTKGFEGALPVAKRARFAHHYIDEEDKQTYMSSIIAFERDQRRRENPDLPDIRARAHAQQRKKRAENKHLRRSSPIAQMSRIISQLGKLLGKVFRPGRYPLTMNAMEIENRFRAAVDAYLNGELVEPKWKRVEGLLNSLLELLPDLDPEIENAARKWFLWLNEGKGVEAHLAKKQGDTVQYERLLADLDGLAADVLREL